MLQVHAPDPHRPRVQLLRDPGGHPITSQPTRHLWETTDGDTDDIHIVGMFPDYASAYNAWKTEAQRTVDNAHMRYFIAHIHRLRDEEAAASPRVSPSFFQPSQFTNI